MKNSFFSPSVFNKLLMMGVMAITSLTAAASTVHTYELTYDGTSTTAIQSAAGQQLANGDTVDFDLKALGNDYFSFGGGHMWIPVVMVECGTRVGNLSMQLLNDGSQVASTSYVGQGSSCVHIPQGGNFDALNFDEVHWNFTQTSTTTDPNTLGNIFSPSNPFMWGTVAYVTVPDNNVPEPASLALVGLGFAGLVASRRRKS